MFEHSISKSESIRESISEELKNRVTARVEEEIKAIVKRKVEDFFVSNIRKEDLETEADKIFATLKKESEIDDEGVERALRSAASELTGRVL